jgi:hypothetical protein
VNPSEDHGDESFRSYSWYENSIRSAIDSDSAAFDLWFVAFYNSQTAFNKDESDRGKWAAVLPTIFNSFEAVHGRVVKSYFCTHFKCAVVITRKTDKVKKGKSTESFELEILFNVLDAMRDDSESVELAALLYECRTLNLKSREFLEGKELERTLDLIYWIVTEASARLDNKTLESDDHQLTVEAASGLRKLWQEQFDVANDFFLRSVKRATDINYCLGMLSGLLIVFGLGLAGGAILSTLKISGLHLNFLEGSYFGGALGAMLSVMSRMTRNKLKLNYETGPAALFLSGIFRPVIGTVFGIFVYFALISQILHVEAPGNGTAYFYFYSVMAFIAGFSERWAPDAISRVAGKDVDP